MLYDQMQLKNDNTTIFWFGILGVLFFVIATIIGAFTIEDYDSISQLISETYANGTPYGNQLRYLGFIPSGIFIALFSFLALKILPPAKLTSFALINLGIFYGLGTIVSSLFPCDIGCHSDFADISISQVIHNIMGTLTYLIVPICIIFIAVSARKWSKSNKLSNILLLLGFISLSFVGMLMVNLHGNLIGLYQRIVEFSILLAILVIAFYIKNLK